MPFLQDFIHKLEVGGGRGFTRYGLIILGVLFSLVVYNWRSYRNLSTQEAMDTAQLARNIADGKGYTTLFIRPFSMYLLKRHAPEATDPTHLKSTHPDLANPPVYPILLAGLLKVAHFNYEIPTKPIPFWSANTKFARYKPDFVIAVFNEMLMMLMIAMVFFLARRLFDVGVAWLSAIMLWFTELFWRFSVSGLSTMLLMVIFTALLWCMVYLEEELRAPKTGSSRALRFVVGAGVLTAVGMLTRYSFGWLILPVLIFIIIFGGPRRIPLAFVALAVFVVLVAPWLVRNYSVSGTLFGTAGYAVVENSSMFPGNQLPRSLEPDLGHFYFNSFWMKLIQNLRLITSTDLPKLGGTWISGFFLVGLLVVFRSPGTRRLRYFVLMALPVLIVAQALGRTQLSDDSLEVNTENLLVLMAPIAIVYGVSLFYLLLEQITLPVMQLRYVIMLAFGIVVSLPMIFTLLPPKTDPVSFPPYYPPACQDIGHWLNPDETAMADVPWAVAWYGNRKCIWLTLKVNDPKLHNDFFTIYDTYQAINLLYLTSVTLDARFQSQWLRNGDWGPFVLESLVNKKVPDSFPLGVTPATWWPQMMALSDWERWNNPRLIKIKSE